MSLLHRVKRLERWRRYEDANIYVMLVSGTIKKDGMKLTFPAYMKEEYREEDHIYPITKDQDGIIKNGKGHIITPIAPRLQPEQVKARCLKVSDKFYNRKVEPDDCNEEEELKEIFEEYPGQWNSIDDLRLWIEDNISLFTKEEITERDQIINIKPEIYERRL